MVSRAPEPTSKEKGSGKLVYNKLFKTITARVMAMIYTYKNVICVTDRIWI